MSEEESRIKLCRSSTQRRLFNNKSLLPPSSKAEDITLNNESICQNRKLGLYFISVSFNGNHTKVAILRKRNSISNQALIRTDIYKIAQQRQCEFSNFYCLCESYKEKFWWGSDFGIISQVSQLTKIMYFNNNISSFEITSYTNSFLKSLKLIID